jgi:hypothetical protein
MCLGDIYSGQQKEGSDAAKYASSTIVGCTAPVELGALRKSDAENLLASEREWRGRGAIHFTLLYTIGCRHRRAAP